MSTDKPSKSEEEYFAKRDLEIMAKQKLVAKARAAAEERASHFMKCPKDGFDLTSEDFHGVTIDRCPHCQGLWLDAGEIDRLVKEEGAGLLGRVFQGVAASLRGRKSDEEA